MTDDPTEDEINARANEKARKRKAARDKMLADKTVEKGLLIVHTGKGKGKSTAAFGLVFRALGNGMRVGVVQFVKGKWETGERHALERFADQIEGQVPARYGLLEGLAGTGRRRFRLRERGTRGEQARQQPAEAGYCATHERPTWRN